MRQEWLSASLAWVVTRKRRMSPFARRMSPFALVSFEESRTVAQHSVRIFVAFRRAGHDNGISCQIPKKKVSNHARRTHHVIAAARSQLPFGRGAFPIWPFSSELAPIMAPRRCHFCRRVLRGNGSYLGNPYKANHE